MEDLNAATLSDAAEFFRTYYAPNNAVLSLVGDFKTDAALKLIKKYFENIPAQAPPPAPNVAEPEQKAERRKTIEDNFAPTARIDLVYKIPPGDSTDWYALGVVGQVLSHGTSSRLHQKLVKEKEIAQSVSAGPDERRGPSLFWFSLGARPGSDLAVLERLVYDEIERLQHELIADWELDKVRMQLRREQAEQLYSTRRRANSMGHYAVYYDDPNLINTVWQKYQNVEKSDLQRVAKKYFNEGNRTVVITMPKPKAAASAADNR